MNSDQKKDLLFVLFLFLTFYVFLFLPYIETRAKIRREEEYALKHMVQVIEGRAFEVFDYLRKKTGLDNMVFYEYRCASGELGILGGFSGFLEEKPFIAVNYRITTALSDRELLAMLAHEFGHHLAGHTTNRARTWQSEEMEANQKGSELINDDVAHIIELTGRRLAHRPTF
jgi:Zn-dependent protease with chaperone function